MRENDTGQRPVAIGNEDRGSDLSAFFHHGESLNGDVFKWPTSEVPVKLHGWSFCAGDAAIRLRIAMHCAIMNRTSPLRRDTSEPREAAAVVPTHPGLSFELNYDELQGSLPSDPEMIRKASKYAPSSDQRL